MEKWAKLKCDCMEDVQELLEELGWRMPNDERGLAVQDSYAIGGRNEELFDRLGWNHDRIYRRTVDRGIGGDTTYSSSAWLEGDEGEWWEMMAGNDGYRPRNRRWRVELVVPTYGPAVTA